MPRVKKNLNGANDLKVIDPVLINDLVPADPLPWKRYIPKIHRISQTFGFQRVETSPLESSSYFPKAAKYFDDLGDFVKVDQEGRAMSLRSHNFLSMLRAYFENEVYKSEKLTKWYYLEPVFAKQGNTVTQLFEYGLAVLGESSAVSDAHMISMLKALLEGFGVKNIVFEINNKGCSDCSKIYEDVLADALQNSLNKLCDNCKNIFASNTSSKKSSYKGELFDVFSCAEELCQNVYKETPQVIDHLDERCNKHLTTLLEALDELEIDYLLNTRIFGDALSSHTIFRVKALSEQEGDNDYHVLGLGARRNRLVSDLSGQDVPVLFFSVPFNDLYKFTQSHGGEQKRDRIADVFLICLGDLAAKKSLRLFIELMKNNIRVAEQFGENGIKNQFKLAEQKGCPLALVIGQKEAMDGTVILREVRTGVQETFSGDRILEEVLKRLSN